MCRQLIASHVFRVFLRLGHGDPMKNSVNLCSIVERYGTDERCRETLMHLRWPSGVKCLRCGSGKVSQDLVSDRKVFVCYSCRYQFSVTVGTIFHDSHLPLTKWFLVTYLLCESKKGISAIQIQRMMGVSYKTAWFLCHRIRKAMAEADGHKMTGTVEIDETYVGGKNRRRGRARWMENKTPVIGIRDREGHLHMIAAKDLNMNKGVLYDIIAANVDKTVDVIMTDESTLYNFNLTQFQKAKHKTVNHSADEFVRYEKDMCVTTNAVESAFSLFKRGIVGAWHKVSAKHLMAYLQEMTWRYNNRKNPYLFRDTLMRLIQSENLEYKELIAA